MKFDCEVFASHANNASVEFRMITGAGIESPRPICSHPQLCEFERGNGPRRYELEHVQLIVWNWVGVHP